MITIEESAKAILEEYFTENEVRPIRVYVSTRSYHGPRLALAPDEASDNDLRYPCGPFMFIISERLEKQVGDIIIRGKCSGFEVIPQRPFPVRRDASPENH